MFYRMIYYIVSITSLKKHLSNSAVAHTHLGAGMAVPKELFCTQQMCSSVYVCMYSSGHLLVWGTSPWCLPSSHSDTTGFFNGAWNVKIGWEASMHHLRLGVPSSRTVVFLHKFWHALKAPPGEDTLVMVGFVHFNQSVGDVCWKICSPLEVSVRRGSTL